MSANAVPVACHTDLAPHGHAHHALRFVRAAQDFQGLTIDPNRLLDTCFDKLL
jgi:hypothetical protein